MMTMTTTIIMIAMMVGSAATQPCFDLTTILQSPLYTWGTSAGDSVLSNLADLCASGVDVPGGFRFFGVIRGSIFVCENGIVSFDVARTAFNFVFTATTGEVIFSVFANDVGFAANGASVYYRLVTDAPTISAITTSIESAFGSFDSTLTLTWVYLVTWSGVTYNGGDATTPVNTFQVVLATDGTKSFAIFNYETIEWTVTPNGDNTQLGFTASDGNRFYNLPVTTPSDVTIKTNAGLPGRWIFQVDQTSVDCSTNYVFCVANPCFNGGTCTAGDCSYTCACVFGYQGDHCEIDIDECASSPCQNGGTCSNCVGSYSCACPPGFTGTDCEITDYCASDPCENGATCVNTAVSYTCTCAIGYTGINCETVIDNCASEPCQNAGLCANSLGSFTCNCARGYIGVFCENEKPCNTNPCKNGGTCIVFGDTFRCRCRPGLGGRVCQRRSQCDPNCDHKRSGCEFYGRGKCDTRCAKGFVLLQNNTCRAKSCRIFRTRRKGFEDCGWDYVDRKVIRRRKRCLRLCRKFKTRPCNC